MTLSDILQREYRNNLVILDKNCLTNINIIISNSEHQFYSITPQASTYIDVPHIHWEYDFMKIVERFKYISQTPIPYISSLDKQIEVFRQTFSSIEDIHSYLDKQVGEPIIFSIRKIISITNPQSGYTYDIRMAIIKDKSDIRQEKLNNLIDHQ